MKIRNILILWMILCIALSSVGCDEKFEDWDTITIPIAKINFFAVSETFPHYDPPYPGHSELSSVGVFVDTSEYNVIARGTLSIDIPNFGLVPTARKSYWYPIIGVSGLASNQPLYIDYAAGKHSFVYSYFTYYQYFVGTSTRYVCSIPAARLAEGEIEFENNSHSTVYFYDEVTPQGGISQYGLLKVVDNPKSNYVNGEVRVRFIHLSMDAGNVRTTILMNDNSETEALLPQQIAFKEATGYYNIPTEGAVLNGYLTLNIYAQGSNTPVRIGIPHQPGHVFDVIIHGFVATNTRQVISSVDPETLALTYKTVEIQESFDATVRQMY